MLQAIFPHGIKLPTFTSLTAGPYKGAGPPAGQFETVDVNLDDIIKNGADGATEGPVGNGNSQVNTNRSELETALKKIPTFSPGDLDAGLEQVKVRELQDLLPVADWPMSPQKTAQAGVEKSLKLTNSE